MGGSCASWEPWTRSCWRTRSAPSNRSERPDVHVAIVGPDLHRNGAHQSSQELRWLVGCGRARSGQRSLVGAPVRLLQQEAYASALPVLGSHWILCAREASGERTISVHRAAE